MVEITEIVVGIAKSNPKWGYTRFRGALSNLGHGCSFHHRKYSARTLHRARAAKEVSAVADVLTAHWETVS